MTTRRRRGHAGGGAAPGVVDAAVQETLDKIRAREKREKGVGEAAPEPLPGAEEWAWPFASWHVPDDAPVSARVMRVGMPLLAFLLPLALYGYTAFPSIPGGDAGELITAAYHLGVAHPPGYPLFTLLSHPFGYLPWGSVAWRISMASVVAAALAVLFVFLATRRLTGNAWAAMLSALMFAFSPLIWLYSQHAEVFSFNNALVAALVYLVVRFCQAREVWVACTGAFVIALGACNQHTLAFYAAPLIPALLVVGRKQLLTPASIGKLALAFGYGLLPLLQMPLAALQRPPGTWGDQSTLDGFMYHFLRKQYGTFQLGSEGDTSLGDMLTRMRLYAHDIVAVQTFYVGAVCMVLGVLYGLRHKRMRTATLLLFGTFSFYVLLFHYLANLPVDDPLFVGIQARFWPQANVIAFTFLGVGFLAFFRVLARVVGAVREPSPLLKLVLVSVVVLLVAVQIGGNFAVNDQHDNYYIEAYGKSILDPIPHGSLVLVKGDLISNSARYLQLCENYRPDLDVIDLALFQFRWWQPMHRHRHPNVSFPGTHYHPNQEGGFDIRMFLDANYAQNKKRPMFVCGGWYPGDPSYMGAYDEFPHGHCSRLRRASANKPSKKRMKKWIDRAVRAQPNHALPPLDKYDELTWERVVTNDDFETWHRLPYELLLFAMRNNDDHWALEQALHYFLALEERNHPGARAHLIKNIGITYGRLAKYDPPLNERMLAYFERYIAAPSPDDDQVQQLVDIVAQYRGNRMAR